MEEPIKNTSVGPKSKAAEKRLLHQAELLQSLDSEAYNRVVAQLIARMTPEARQHLSRSLRSPKNAIGTFRDHPLWGEINEAIELNRQSDEAEVGAE